MSFNSDLNEAIGTAPGIMTRPGLQATRSGTPEILTDTFDPADAPVLAAASAALARLDDRLAGSAPAVVEGWRARAFIHEAAAAARLNGDFADADEVRLADAGALDRPPDPELGQALLILQMIRSAARRHPRQMFTPLRLISLTRLRLNRSDPDPRLPIWLQDRLSEPGEIRASLGKALDPVAVERWKAAAPLLASADIIHRWHDARAAERVGAAAGRVLASAWPARSGATNGLVLMPSVGFLGHASEYRPDWGRRWTGAFLRASLRSAEWGLRLHTDLVLVRRRLLESAGGRRATSRLPALIDRLVAVPSLSAAQAAVTLGMTDRASRSLLEDLHAGGMIREVSGRGSFRVYAVA
jgi:HTH DNA binding domain